MPKKIDHQARRRQIAKAAISVIGVNGIDNTRLVDVARAANATTGSITHYFEGKDAVLLAALDHVAQGLLQLLHSKLDEQGPEPIIDRALLALPLDENGMRDWRVWLAFFGRAVGDPALAAVNNAYYDELREGLAHIIRTHQKGGHLSGDINPVIAANSIITAVDGLGIRASLDPENWTPERQTMQLRAMLRPLLPKC